MGQASLTFTGIGPRNTNAKVSFVAWNQRPMEIERVVEYTTRLGSSQLIISNIKNESPASQVNAVIANSSNTKLASVMALTSQLQTLRENVGTRCTFTDENGLVIERCYIVNMTYNIKVVDGGASAIAYVQMTIMQDVERKKQS